METTLNIENDDNSKNYTIIDNNIDAQKRHLLMKTTSNDEGRHQIMENDIKLWKNKADDTNDISSWDLRIMLVVGKKKKKNTNLWV